MNAAMLTRKELLASATIRAVRPPGNPAGLASQYSLVSIEFSYPTKGFSSHRVV